MALARVKVWNPGDVLTAADLNAEFNNLLNNPIALISPTTGVITFTTAQTFPANQVSGSLTGAGSKVKGLRGTLSSQSGTFTAEQYLLQSTDGGQSFVLNSTASFAVSVGTAGPIAGGRDKAAVFASTYVHWYAISTGSGSTALAGTVSSNPPPTGPIMPANYSAWAYLGTSPYTSASTTVSSTHRFNGNQAYFDHLTANTLLSGGGSTGLANVSISSAIAPNIPAFFIRFSAGTQNGILSIDNITPTSNGSTFYVLAAGAESEVWIPQPSTALTYQTAAAGGTVNLFLSGYILPNV